MNEFGSFPVREIGTQKKTSTDRRHQFDYFETTLGTSKSNTLKQIIAQAKDRDQVRGFLFPNNTIIFSSDDQIDHQSLQNLMPGVKREECVQFFYTPHSGNLGNMLFVYSYGHGEARVRTFFDFISHSWPQSVSDTKVQLECTEQGTVREILSGNISNKL